MNTLSVTEIEKYLLEYSQGIEYWTAEAGDTFLIAGARELLGKAQGALNHEQQARLMALDAKASSLLANIPVPRHSMC